MRYSDYPLYFVWSLDCSDSYFVNAMSSLASCMRYHGNSVGYVIVTTRELSLSKQDALRRLYVVYGCKVLVKRLYDLHVLQRFCGSWPAIIFAKLLLCNMFAVPYMAVDADVLFLKALDDISFLKDGFVASIEEGSKRCTIHKKELGDFFGVSVDHSLSAGSLLVSVDAIDSADFVKFVLDNGDNSVVKFPEQDLLSVYMQDHCMLFPPNIGCIVAQWRGVPYYSDCDAEFDILNCPFTFVHVTGTKKQWDPESFMYNVHKQYIDACGLLT